MLSSACRGCAILCAMNALNHRHNLIEMFGWFVMAYGWIYLMLTYAAKGI